MKNQKISIIIVSLNTRIDFIKTLSSIKKQNYHNYDIIVIDGNSIDGTKEEIMKRKVIISKFIIENIDTDGIIMNFLMNYLSFPFYLDLQQFVKKMKY